MARINYNKLITRGAKNRMDKNGVKYKLSKISTRRFNAEMRNKLVEEATEVVDAANRQYRVLELAQLINIIAYVMTANRISAAELEAACEKDRVENGGFSKDLFLLYTEDDGYEKNKVRTGKVKRRVKKKR